MSVYILDTETSGGSKSDQVIELAYHKCAPLQDYLTELVGISFINEATQFTQSNRYLPSCTINPHAHAVHGISRTDLTGKPSSAHLTIPEDIVYIVGHNISFDKRLLGQSNLHLLPRLESIKYICTLNLAKLISKHYGVYYENHQLDTLAKHYYPDYAHLLVTPLHSAKNDVVKNLLVLLKLVQHLPESISTWEKLYEMQENIKKVR